jgi:hypothetical protein
MIKILFQAWRLGGADGTALVKWRTFGHFPGGIHRLALAALAQGTAAAAAKRPGSAAQHAAGVGARCGGPGSMGCGPAEPGPLLPPGGAGGGDGDGGAPLLVTGSLDGTVVAWRTAGLEPLFQMKLANPGVPGGDGGLSCLGFCGADRLFCAAGDAVRCV